MNLPTNDCHDYAFGGFRCGPRLGLMISFRTHLHVTRVQF